MDIEDNDAQDQNYQLVEEGSSKVSSVLRPYALPKFEYDDNLHAHLRFDSLVENDVFLGISNQEDNHWIEEYSRGSNTIQFSSSVVESTRKNVWSEATSSESVEMLLNSVGQEEKVVEETRIKELDASDRRGSLTTTMDPYFQENFVGSKASSDCEQSHATLDTLEVQHQETPNSGGELDLVVIGARKVKETCDDVHQEASKITNQSSINELLEDPSVSKVEFENASSLQNADASIEECQDNLQEVPERTIDNANDLVKNFDSSESNHIIKNKENSSSGIVVETCTYSVDKLSVVLNIESVDKQPVEGSIPVDEEPIVSAPIESCDMQIDEEHDSRICSAEQSECSKINQELDDNIHEESLAVPPNSGYVETQAIEDTNTKSQIYVHSHPVEETEKGDGIDFNSEIGEGNEVDNACKTSLTTKSSAEMHAEDISNNDETAGNSASEVHTTDSIDANQIMQVGDETRSSDSNDENQIMQVGDETRALELDAITKDQDAAFNDGHDAKLPLDSEDVNMDVVGAPDSQKNVEQSSSFEGCEGVIAVNEGSESNMAVLTDAGAAVGSSEISSPNTQDVVTEDQPRSPIFGVSLLHNVTEEKVVMGSSQKGTPEVDNTVNYALNASLPVDEKDTVSDGAEKVVPEPAGHCDPFVGNLNASTSEQTVEDNQGDLECSNISAISCNLSAEEGKNADEGGLVVLKESITGEDRVEPFVGNLNASLSEQTVEDNQGGLECSNISPISCNLSAEEGKNADEGGLVVPKESVTGEDRVEPFVGNLNVSSSEQTAEDNQGALKCSDISPISCNLSAEEGNIADEGGLVVPKESITGEDRAEPLNSAVNTSDEQQASVDVAGPSEHDINHVAQNGGGSVSVDKPQSSSFSDTQDIELSQIEKSKQEITKGFMNENSSLSKPSNDKEGLQTVSSSSATKEEKGFTFEVNASAGQNISSLTNTKVSSVTSGGSQLDPIKLHEDTPISPQPPSGAANETRAKKTSERKPRRKSVGRETAKKGNNSTDTTPARRSQQVEKSAAFLTPPASGHVSPISTSNQSDLNNSTSQFHQSFTDNQQVQLRAQILVYGSLISGVPPEEPHMIAAFGQSDGGRRAWEAAWHACLERVRGQTSQVNNPKTPMQSRLGNKDSDRGIKIGSAQSKVITSPIVSPMIPIPSPLWNISTPHDVTQSSAMHQTLTSLHPYQAPRAQGIAGHNPSWLPHSPFPGQWVTSSPIAPFNARFSALPVTESVKLTTVKESGTPGLPVIPVDPSAGPTVSSGPSSLSNMKKSTASSSQPSSDSKSRRRKKAVVSQSEVATLSAPAARSPWAPHTEGHNQISFLSQNQTNSGTAPDVTKTPVSISSKRHLGQPSSVGPNTEKIATREDIVSKIEESKVQAEDAALNAATAVNHCQSVWSQLETQKNSGLISDDEAKLASSAVSIAAASSVAKVAAAAAKIASNVAEQAKLTADEVFQSSRNESYDQTTMTSHDKATAIISAAKEAARRRIQAASAASKHAENLDAIVKAAELAAEAVSQAGKIVAMGNPLTLGELVEAGPDSYWKTPQSSNLQGGSDKPNVENTPNNKQIQTSKHGLSPREDSGDLAKNPMIIDGISGSVTSDVDHNLLQSTSGTSKENVIKEGCLVEVYKNDNKYKGAWFAANVLTLKDGKAFVCYTEIQSDDGSEKLKEWVPLEVEGTEAPRIRVAHPMTIMRFEGAKKRGRTALTDYAWCSGDRVDVWLHDCWCEAVVLETNKIDLTSLTVQFPAQEKTSVVRSWHVRPTIIWKDGKWIEWSSLKGSRSSEGDTPHNKRQKSDNPVVEGKEFSISVDLVDSGRHQEIKTLPSSAHGSTFNVGKSTKNENKPNTHKPTKSGLQKERSRVVFGVPKPGKKQKFMDPNDSVKPATHLPSRGSKNDSKNDTKEKQCAEVKPKVLKSRKPPVPLVKTLTQKEKPKPSNPVSRDACDENLSGQHNRMDIGSSSSTDETKETSSSKTVSQRFNKRKFVPDDVKSTKVEVKDKSSTSEAEPRRSNRKIQPTSRLLEGLQSSLTVSKIPSISHASQRSHKATTPKGNPGC